jgi:hypothetical protein
MKKPQPLERMNGLLGQAIHSFASRAGRRCSERNKSVDLRVRQRAANRFYRIPAPEPDAPLVPEVPLEPEASDEPLLPVAGAGPVGESLAFVDALGVVLMPGVSPGGAEAPDVAPMSVEDPEVLVSVVPHAASTMAHKRERVHFIIRFS